ncbi:MAG: WbuC family cupin fold metalloprotein [Alistipes sp.]|nr:WbuC family cupin fold metalloprotein [Alistipes sp.]MBQ3198176.1 WbuC family cupin fold metalloprotein [Alistipes sp.]
MPTEKGYQYIDVTLMDSVAVEARLSPRLRKNHNFHHSEDEPVNRLINVMHRGTYLPVHRHSRPDRSESCIVLRGRVGVTFYDDEGNLTDSRLVGPSCDCVGYDIDAGVWHGLVVLEDDTVLFEVKQGPYAPISADNIASWSPAADDTSAVKRFIEELENHFIQK